MQTVPKPVGTNNRNQQDVSSKSTDTAADRFRKHKGCNSIVYNLSKRKLTTVEQSVLELGITFSPSKKALDKDQIASDMFQFVRKLKLREYFEQNKDSSEPVNLPPAVQDDERDPTKWQERHPTWYPDKVRNQRSEGLCRWIDSILDSMNGELSVNERKLFNNLTAEQRLALKTLAADDTITIKPADKGGALVILDSVEYEEACKKMLSN